MKTKQLFIGLLLIFSLLAACSPSGGETAVPTATTKEEQITPGITEESSTDLQTYRDGRFSLQYPSDLTFYENERPSTDGVLASLPDSIALQHGNFLLTLTTFTIADNTRLSDFIDGHRECADMLPGLPTTVGNLDAMLFADTPCGLSGTTYLFAVVGDTGYRFAIESADPFAAVQADVQPILDSFQSSATPSTGVQIAHNGGLSFTYDPTLLGETNIQDIPATADQGMFEQPSPAHTWVGFVPAGIVRDYSNHWQLTWEPYLMVYNLNAFGSFATGDQYARERVAQFQELAAERPSTISDTIPVIPPINAGQIIRAQVKWLDFGSGSGVRFLTQYDQAANPINNEGLVYIFQGITNDGLHGVTAVFPLDASGLPDSPAIGEAAYTAFIENFAAEMTAATNYLNTAAESDFDPLLSELDALVQSITVAPSETDFPVVTQEPQHGQVASNTDIFTSSTGDEVIASLQAGDPLIINGSSEDGRRSRILCPDGTTGNCWVVTEAITTITATEGPVFYTGNYPDEGAVVGITAVSANAIYDGPGETYQAIGKLLADESVSVHGIDETEQWWAIECPRGIGLACWVVIDTAVNEPTDFFLGDGWQDVSSDFVTFRLPGSWGPTAVEPGMGSVLAKWHLGIPGLSGDQTIAFFAMPFAELKPDDVAAECDLLIGDEPGVKWVRRGAGYTSYDYYNAGTAGTEAAGAGSFGLHVTVPEDDPDLVSTLDMVAASILFNK